MGQKYTNENVDDNIAKSVNRLPTVSRRMKKKNKTFSLIILFVFGILVGVLVSSLVLKKGNSNESDSQFDSKIEQQGEQSVGTLDNMLQKEGILIDTPFVELFYPEQWSNMIDVKPIEGEVYTVQFFALVEGKEEVHIFDMIFNGETGYLLGYLKAEDGTQMEVRVESYAFDLGEDWTEDEKNMVYTMAEDVNYTIGMLEKEARFAPAS